MSKQHAIPFANVELRGGFWQEKQSLIRSVTIHAVRDRFAETGRFDALKCQWRDGKPNKPHIFWDSDAAKWMESVAYLIAKEPMPELEAFVETLIDDLEQQQQADGYLNSYFTGVEPARRWQDRSAHELYCAGHLIEAAVAWKQATGRELFLKMMCRYVDYIDRVFRTEQTASFLTPGHEEIELALVKLYHETGEKKYLDLGRWFVDMRGANDKDVEPADIFHRYRQSHIPCEQQTTAEGHSVRACYLYAAMADLAREYEYEPLAHACEALFDNIVNQRMYITGGIGSSHQGETFTVDYHLPNQTAYAESCAAISLIYFAQRMLLLSPDSRYADVVERALYNGFLSSLSLDGSKFFYSNPLEIDVVDRHSDVSWHQHDWRPASERVEVFSCSCCPPNITRLIATLGDYICTTGKDCLYVHQYMDAQITVDSGSLQIQTDYPRSGEIRVHAQQLPQKQIALRIPGWCAHFELSAPYTMHSGYALIDVTSDTEMVLRLDMPAVMMYADPRVRDAQGKAAVMRGPVVYCMEAHDQTADVFCLSLKENAVITASSADPFGLPNLKAEGYETLIEERAPLYRSEPFARRKTELTLIPYYAFANRGESDMRVWIPVER